MVGYQDRAKGRSIEVWATSQRLCVKSLQIWSALFLSTCPHQWEKPSHMASLRAVAHLRLPYSDVGTPLRPRD